MTTSTVPQRVDGLPRKPYQPPAFGSKDDLLTGWQESRPLRTQDVIVLGKTYRVRELLLGEADEIQYRTIKNELDGKGGVAGHADLRGTTALRVACGLQHQDGMPFFADPFTEYEKLLKLPADILEPLNKAIVELSVISEEGKAELGKGIGRTGGSASSSG